MLFAGRAKDRFRVGVGIALSCLAIGACVKQDDSTISVARRNEAGVEIVENAGDLWSMEEQWRVASETAILVGEVDGDEPYLFDGIVGADVLSDGRLVVANRGSQSLRWFDPTGQFLFERGRSGQGPGEFSWIGDITRIEGDSIVAVDLRSRRFTTFGPAGGLGATTRVAGLVAAPGRVYRLTEGDWLLGIGGFSTSQLGNNADAGVHRLTSPILRIASDGSRIDTVGVFPGQEVEVRATGDRVTVGPARFGRKLSYAVWNDEIFIGTADQLQVDVYAQSGVQIRSVRAPAVGMQLTREIRSAYEDFLRSRVASASPEVQAEMERTISGIDYPSRLPAYSSLLVDDEGNLWVGEYRYDLRTPTRYLVFDSGGRFITRVRVPPNTRVFTVSEDHVWGRTTGELGVEQIVGYLIMHE